MNSSAMITRPLSLPRFRQKKTRRRRDEKNRNQVDATAP